MPKTSEDGKYVHCTFCNQKFRFKYDAVKHEKDSHSNQL